MSSEYYALIAAAVAGGVVFQLLRYVFVSLHTISEASALVDTAKYKADQITTQFERMRTVRDELEAGLKTIGSAENLNRRIYDQSNLLEHYGRRLKALESEIHSITQKLQRGEA